jgi:hypothetical protein
MYVHNLAFSPHSSSFISKQHPRASNVKRRGQQQGRAQWCDEAFHATMNSNHLVAKSYDILPSLKEHLNGKVRSRKLGIVNILSKFAEDEIEN